MLGRVQLSLKVPNIEFDFDVRFLMYLHLLTKPNVEIENYESLSKRTNEHSKSNLTLMYLLTADTA